MDLNLNFTTYLLKISNLVCPGLCFPAVLVGDEFSCSAGDASSIPGREDPLEEEMATHSSILAWRIPWMEEPAGLQSVGSQRVRHD